MTLNEFKWIWWMEFAHRSWGRAIGAAFFIPAAGFWFTGKLTKYLKKRVLFAGSLLIAQGLMGWYMVQSGLDHDRFQGPNDIPRVSQYRLAAHLGLALTLYMGLLRTGLDCISSPTCAGKLGKIRFLAHTCKGLVFLTALSGAFVAGLDAGLVYNSFPKMADKWFPDDLFALQPTFLNWFENPTTVQFDHRIMGITTLTAVNILFALILKNQKFISARARTAATLLFTASWLQATLGVSTLLLYVPTSLAVSHQSGSIILLTLATWLTHELKHIVKYLPK